MKISMCSFLGSIVLTLAAIGVAPAEEVKLAPTFTAFAQSQAAVGQGITQQDIVLTSHEAFAGDGACSCQPSCTPERHVGRDFFVCKDRCAGIIAGTETVFLRPFASGGLLETGGAGAAQMNYNPSQRYWLGYQSADGLGARIRYWEFDRGATGTGGTAIGVEFRNLDAEMTQAVDFKRWNLLFAGGLRYQETGANGAFGGVDLFESGFNGVGLTFATQATRDLNRSGSLRMTMGARYSSIFGNTKGTIFGAPFTNNDDLVNIVELNIGPQYRRALRNGAYLTLGAGIEAQYYSNGIYNNGATTFDGEHDVGFVGFASSIAITR